MSGADDAGSLTPGAARWWALVAAAALLLLMWTEPPALQWLRLQSFDAWQRALPRERVSAPAIVVAIDERSLAEYGQWPWPRTRLAEIIDRIAAARPAAIGLDIFMPEADRLSPQRILQTAALSPALAAEVARLPDHDAVLVAALRDRPVVLGLASAQWAGAAPEPRPLPAAPMRLRGEPTGTAALMAFDTLVRSLAPIEAAAAGHGLLNARVDAGLVHRVPLLARVGEVLLPALSVELWRVAARVPALEATFDAAGLTALRVGDLQLPAAPDGNMWLRYGRYDATRYVSAADLLQDRVDPRRLERRLVLVAVTGLGLLDQIGTPLDVRVPGIEIHAQVIENLFDGSWLSRPPWTRWVEAALLLGVVLVSILALPRLSPRRAFALFGALLVLFLLLGLAGVGAGVLLDVATPALGTTLAGAIVLGTTLAESQRQRLQLASQLQAQRESAARVAGELEAARRVQVGMLPEAATVALAEPRLALDACMQPAREVGGDLYDVFALGQERWCVMIGDVSGKGLPAAMFMALVKAQCQAALLREPGDLAAALGVAERAITRHNPESMFVTLLVMVIDLAAGSVEYCNAGHEPPWRLRAGTPSRPLLGAGRPPVGVLEGFAFEPAREALQPGDALCLLTDGVTEALDREQQIYGRERLQQRLDALASREPAQIVAGLREDIERFAGAAEQADDIAIVVLRYQPQRAATSAGAATAASGR